ncbi:glycosyl hydrolase-related protein [Nonomuraea dietziae]|uniref:glycosyl hydrolase-related protein n=1 Tax=Nonomuraea dietziae TaxID=65515 RepID=UPI0033E46FFC
MAGGYAMNLPLLTVKGGAAAVPDPLVTTDGDAAVIEAIKLADDRSGDVIVRLYESLGGQAATVVRPAFPIASVVETDLLERPIAEVAHDGGGVPLRLRAFQIRTLRIRPCPGLRR